MAFLPSGNRLPRSAAAAAAGSLLLLGCRTPADTTANPPELPCTGNAATGPQMINDWPLYTFMSAIDLPPGAHIASGGSAISPTTPTLVDLSLDLCLPTTADLIPLATTIARTLKQDPLGARTATLSIAHVGPGLPARRELRDPAFQLHAWNDAADSRLWEVLPATPN
ncbi:hypothetical protein [Nocardia sp. NPDC050435]|uniref:hypothetical protein n=1 Tax=Nocardia sp. NPDC050435 TaxID=3155040 RepID=UPI0033F06D7F